MNTKPSRTMFRYAMTIMVVMAVILSVTSEAYAAPPSPFIGHWQAVDIDGGDIRLAIGGRPGGPLKITWTESYFGFCGGKAGIARGTGWLNEGDPYMLEAHLLLTCFTTGAKVDFYPVWRYDPANGWLTSRDDGYGGWSPLGIALAYHYH
jgi:hypothetical protein